MPTGSGTELFAATLFVLLCVGMGLVLLGLVRFMTKVLLKTEKHKLGKEEPYECGVPLLSDARTRFGVRFYLVALSFVLFDVETVFLLPYAVSYRQLGHEGLYGVLIFVAILALGLYYEIQRGLLNWSEGDA
ncbi:MAG: NADH-quinone oxidoreductase subunit A [Planctomycetota bacterium]|nr:NADH-quinone oxidoreductase subunit A [Planctomycetota bacterium]